MSAPVVFDVDGTLINTEGPSSIYTNRAALLACPAFPGAREALARAMATRPVVFLTGRSEVVRDVTVRQLRDLGVQYARVYMQQMWAGWDAYHDHKVGTLRHLNAVCYIGDRHEDRVIAEAAGVRFLTPEDVGIQRGKVLA